MERTYLHQDQIVALEETVMRLNRIPSYHIRPDRSFGKILNELHNTRKLIYGFDPAVSQEIYDVVGMLRSFPWYHRFGDQERDRYLQVIGSLQGLIFRALAANIDPGTLQFDRQATHSQHPQRYALQEKFPAKFTPQPPKH